MAKCKESLVIFSLLLGVAIVLAELWVRGYQKIYGADVVMNDFINYTVYLGKAEVDDIRLGKKDHIRVSASMGYWNEPFLFPGYDDIIKPEKAEIFVGESPPISLFVKDYVQINNSYESADKIEMKIVGHTPVEKQIKDGEIINHEVAFIQEWSREECSQEWSRKSFTDLITMIDDSKSNMVGIRFITETRKSTLTATCYWDDDNVRDLQTYLQKPERSYSVTGLSKGESTIKKSWWATQCKPKLDRRGQSFSCQYLKPIVSFLSRGIC